MSQWQNVLLALYWRTLYPFRRNTGRSHWTRSPVTTAATQVFDRRPGLLSAPRGSARKSKVEAQFGTWLACGAASGYAEAFDRSRELFRVSQGESFTAVSGRMWVASPWRVAIETSIPIELGAEPREFAQGDTLHVLHYLGEGRFNVWYRGVEIETEAFWVEEGAGAARAMLSEEATAEYWVDVETSTGRHGWVLVEEGLVAMANLRDPDAPWCPNRALDQPSGREHRH